MYNTVKIFFKHHLLKQKLKKQNVVIDFSLKEKDKKHVLIVDDKVPEFDKDSGSRRLTEIIKILIKNGYKVSLLANVKEYKFNTTNVSFFRKLGVNVYQPAVSPNGKLVTRERFLKTIVGDLSYVWLHRPGIFTKYYPLVKAINPNVPVVFDMVDFHYLRMKREAELTNDPAKHKIAQEHLKEEMENCKRADKIIVISDMDKDALLEFYNEEAKMEVIGNIHDHINRPADFKTFSERDGLLFIGGFAHAPNEDAVLYLHDKVMPLVWEKHPGMKVNIVGSNPTKAVLDLNSAQFAIVGYVEDASVYFTKAKVFVALLRYGAGIKGKIGQSLEYSLPLVTTAVGAEGFDFSDYRGNMVAETPEELANLILKLYNDETLWNEISHASADFIAPYSLKNVEQAVIRLLHGL